ncbi:hypothetical protein [Nocardia sp. NPDC049149]|uniref:hypothetical protein n=1 Tax=Nocardia sp. NPDC049149 TaxID=3364315 RepID=UPI003712D746
MTAANRQLVLTWALLLSLAVTIMHSLTACPPNRMHGMHGADSPEHPVAVVLTSPADTAPVAGCEHDQPGVRAHQCVGVPSPLFTIAPPGTPALSIELSTEPETRNAVLVRAFGGRGPPWTTPSLSQLSILRV